MREKKERKKKKKKIYIFEFDFLNCENSGGIFYIK